MAFDGKAWGEQIVDVVKGYVEKATAPLLEKIADLEAAHLVLQGFYTDDDIGAVKEEIAALRAAMAAIPAQEPKGVDEIILAGIVEEKIAAAVSALPLPKDGKDGKDGEKGADGRDGLNGDPGMDGHPGKDGKDGADGKDGRDGLDVKELFVADGGDLIAVFSDGRSKNLGRFRGENGKDADLTAVEQLVQTRLDTIAPKEMEMAPPALAERISLAVKMMAQMPEAPIVQREYAQAIAPNFTVNLPPAIPPNLTVNLPQTEIPIQFGENVVNVSMPDQKAPEVKVEAPIVNVTVPEAKKRRTETTVTEHDENGRIARFVQREL